MNPNSIPAAAIAFQEIDFWNAETSMPMTMPEVWQTFARPESGKHPEASLVRVNERRRRYPMS
jgi:hypothetical protein